ncbi:EAL domain-containing response regulator [Zobellella aerophila]|uniref:EAL domain-containing response regulator n=2 Tax=Zobellella aerophila TaxID=870480 RepID=A0ABP6VNI8_9GAMM
MAAFATTQVDLVILDLHLGAQGGIDVLQYLSRVSVKAPILIMSSCDTRTANSVINVGRACNLNMVGFLPKSQTVEELVALVTQFDRVAHPVDDDSLTHALENDQFFLMYQPKIDLRDGGLVSVEALLRWKDPEQGIITPDHFISMAEKSGHIDPITWKVMDMALAQLACWQARGMELTMAINMSAVLLAKPDVSEIVQWLLASHGIAPNKLILELTETAGLHNLMPAQDAITRLRAMGVELSLDDFGTGHASFTQLYQIPFSEIKVDRMFVGRMPEDDHACAIVEAIVGLGKSLGIRVVAEGIERQQQLEQLKGLGCEVGQGYLFGRPMSPGDIEQRFMHG